MVIDLSVNNSTANGEFSGNITLKAAGKEEPRVCAVLELAFPVDADSARILEEVLPGASALFNRANVAAEEAETAEAMEGAAAGAEAGAKGTFGEVKVRIPHVDYRVALVSDDMDEDSVVFDAEVRSIRLKATPKAKKYLVKLQTGVLDHEDIAGLALLFASESIKVTTTKRGQQVLPFTRAESDVAAIGRIVSGVNEGSEYAGIVVGVAVDEEIGQAVEIDDFGDHFLVPIASIAGSIEVFGDECELDDAVEEYREVASNEGLAASWVYLVPALGRKYLEEGGPDRWTLSQTVMSAACDLARTKASA